MTTQHSWQDLDLTGLVSRLRAAQALLAEAAVLATAQDTARLSGMADLQARLTAERDGGGDADARGSRTFR
jgi:hypothetical protein